MNVLFLCKYNRFRSKLAEAFFNKISKRHQAKSAGIIKGPHIDEPIRLCAKQNGVEIKGTPQILDICLLEWSNMIIIVADDVQDSILRDNFSLQDKTLRQWAVHDTSNKNTAEMDNIAKIIEKKVSDLLVEIDKE